MASAPCVPIVYQEVVSKGGSRVHLYGGAEVSNLQRVGVSKGYSIV